jgi:hypothetical protein
MAHNGKRGFLSSLFGKRKQTEQEETADLESRHRLDERIQQILAERVETPERPIIEETRAALMIQKQEVEPEVELFPISASVLNSRKAPVHVAFGPSSLDVVRSYATSER